MEANDMVKQVILVRYGEISLKGKNRHLFEERLISNIRRCLDANLILFFSIKRPRGRIIVYLDNNKEYKVKDFAFFKYIFGIISYNLAFISSMEQELINKSVLREAKGYLSDDRSFRVSVHRSDKSFSKTSIELEKDLGSMIVEETGAKVDLKGFDFNVAVELVAGKALVFVEPHDGFRGPGGLPVGITGKVIVLVEDEDSLRAAVSMMKRGCYVVFALVKGGGVTKDQLDGLKKYSCHDSMEIVSIIKIEEINQLAQELNINTIVFGIPFIEIEEYEKKIEKRFLKLYPLAL